MTTDTAPGATHAADQVAKLARMANQIADFFKAYPDEQASASIAEHINQFWNRHMRDDFLSAYDAGSQELHPLVQGALARINPSRSR